MEGWVNENVLTGSLCVKVRWLTLRMLFYDILEMELCVLVWATIL